MDVFPPYREPIHRRIVELSRTTERNDLVLCLRIVDLDADLFSEPATGTLHLLHNRSRRCQEPRSHYIRSPCKKLPQQIRGNVQSKTELFREAFVTLCPSNERCITAFGKPCSRISGERVGDADVTKSHERIGQRFIERLSATDRQQMLLATGFSDLNEVVFRQTIGVFQNWRGHQRVIVKRELADRLAWRAIYCGKGFAKVDQGSCLNPPDQGNKETIERTYLGFTEAIHIGQEQVRDLPQNLGISPGQSIDGTVQLRE